MYYLTLKIKEQLELLELSVKKLSVVLLNETDKCQTK